MSNEINIRNLNARRERQYEPLVESLCTGNTYQKPVFRYNKDLMVFAAMVGYSKNKRKKLNKEDTIPIALDTYSTDQKDTYIYLVALMTEKDATILKNENLPKAIQIYEEYCNAGLAEIKLQLDENPGHEKVDTLIQMIWEKAIQNEEDVDFESNIDEIDPEF